MAIKLKKEEEIKEIKASNENINVSNINTSQNDIENIDTNIELSKEEKKQLKNKSKRKKSKLEVFTIISMIGVITSAVLLCLFMAAPVICIFLCVFVSIGLVFFCLLITACSLGLAWISKEVRDIVNKMTNIINTLSSAGTKAAEIAEPAFVYVSAFGVAFLIASLVLSIIGYKKNKGNEENPFKKKMIISIIFSSLVVISIIANLINYYVIKK